MPFLPRNPAHGQGKEANTSRSFAGTTGVEWEQWDDQWTVVTKDRGRSAQFEHTIVVTENGAEILTLP